MTDEEKKVEEARVAEEARLAEEAKKDLPSPAAAGLTREEISSIIEEKFNAIVARINPNGVPAVPAPSNNGHDVLDQIADELAEEEGIKPEVAKGFVKKFVKIHDHLNKGTQEELNAFKMRDKFVQVFNGKPEAEVKEVAPKMAEIFKTLSPMEQNFVLHSPDGGDWIYDKAKRSSGLYSQPAAVVAAASAGGGRAPSPERKLGSKADIFAKATEALLKGDRAGYESAMDQIRRG